MTSPSTYRIPGSDSDLAYLHPASSAGERTIAFTVRSGSYFQVHVYTLGNASSSQVTSGDDDSYVEDIDPTGRFILIRTFAQNLVGSLSPTPQLILRDRQDASGRYTLVSEDGNGNLANLPSIEGSIGPNQESVVFQSKATNLDGSTGSLYQIFHKDLTNGSVQMISRNNNQTRADDHALNPVFLNSNQVAFDSLATNLTSSNTSSTRQVYIRDISNQSVSDVTTGDEDSWNPQALDKTNLAFQTDDADLLTNSDIEMPTQVVRHDGSSTIVSTDWRDRIASSPCRDVSASRNDQDVSFTTRASNFTANSGSNQIIAYQHDKNRTLPVSITQQNTFGGNDSSHSTITSDGFHASFESIAEDLISTDTNNERDIFVRENWQNAVLPPIADAGSNRHVIDLNTKYTLDGTGSRDPQGLDLSYQWSVQSKPSGSNVNLIRSDQAKASVEFDLDGTYTFKLKVTNAKGKSDTATVDIQTPKRGITRTSSNITSLIGTANTPRFWAKATMTVTAISNPRLPMVGEATLFDQPFRAEASLTSTASIKADPSQVHADAYSTLVLAFGFLFAMVKRGESSIQAVSTVSKADPGLVDSASASLKADARLPKYASSQLIGISDVQHLHLESSASVTSNGNIQADPALDCRASSSITASSELGRFEAYGIANLIGRADLDHRFIEGSASIASTASTDADPGFIESNRSALSSRSTLFSDAEVT